MTAHTLIVISNPQVCTLASSDVARASRYLPDSSPVSWLSNEEAFLINFHATDADLSIIDQSIKESFADIPIDYAIRRSDTLKKKLLIADMDSTIIQQECIDEIADFAGLKDKVSAITEQAMNGALDFEAALKERVSLLKGLDEKKLEQVIAERLELTPGAKTLVQTMKQNGAFCALVSGGFTFFTSRIAQMVGFHTTRANTLNIENKMLTGTVQEPVLGKQAKLDALNDFVRENNIKISEALAVGDGANDLAMIEAAGFGVSFHAKPVVAERANAQVNYGDLETLLFMQGYKRSEFISA